MFERGERTANTTSRTPQRRAWETTLDGQGAVQGILWCSAGSKNYGDLVGKRIVAGISHAADGINSSSKYYRMVNGYQ
ncbi:hypothetical protein ACLKA6_000670 [Drosophila palustris]